MGEYKKYKIQLILLSNASFDPHTMVIMSSNTNTTKRTVFRSSRSSKLACSALILIQVDFIVNVFLIFSKIQGMIRIGNYTWRGCSSFIIKPKRK